MNDGNRQKNGGNFESQPDIRTYQDFDDKHHDLINGLCLQGLVYMNERLTRQQVVSALVNLFVIILSLFVIISLILKLTGHSPTLEQILVSSLIALLIGYGAVFKGYVDLRVDHLGEKMDLKFHAFEKQIDLKFNHVDERIDNMEKQMDYRFSRIEKKLGIA